MCGIAGLLDEERASSNEQLSSIAARMANTLRHRGPDMGDVWVDTGAGIALGHRRLAILDLSPAGHQPMVSASGRFVVVYNGEIYNFRDLRRELETKGERFRGYSDTEVLLAAVEHWGLRAALQRMQGMFAFALWDRQERQLHLVRDRLGKKPLYFGWAGSRLLFGSELKALRAHPEFDAEVDRRALALFLRHSCVPAPYSIYRDVYKLPPAGHLTLDVRDGDRNPRGSELLENVEVYWSISAVAEQHTAARSTFDGSEAGAVDTLEELLRSAVADRMVSDVPLGALLSGGIDSSTVVALMQAQASSPVKTFTIGFGEPGFNEAADAERVARHLGTDHTELEVTPDDALAVIPRLPDVYDEPFADQSQIPTLLVAELAKRKVTVALSGDGGDEVFGGYQRHFEAPTLERLSRLPKALRGTAALAMTSISPDRWDSIFAALERILPRKRRRALSGDQVHKLAGILHASGPAAAYLAMTSHWTEPSTVVRGAGHELATALTDNDRQPKLENFEHVMMALDTLHYLADDILTKVDRASMAVSLEVRSPLLDKRVAEFAWRLPIGLKIRDGSGKWILRQVLRRFAPTELFDRPKHGFGMPIGHWLRGPLKPWAEALLDEQRLRDEGYFEPQPILEKWQELQSGRRNWAYHLWDVLMFQAWQERWLQRD